MRWSAQVEEACHRLIVDAETEGDKVLAYAARIARLCVNAAGISRRAAEEPVFGRHAILQVGALKAALEQLKSELPSDVSEHSAVVAYLYSAEAGIYELALYHHSASLPISTYSPSSSNPELESRRVAYLTTLLLVCQSCIEFFLASDVTYCMTSSMLAFSYCIKIAYKLQILKIPGWDAAIVRSVVDPVRCLERAAQAAEAGNEVLKARTGEDSVFKNAAEHLWKSAPLWRVNFDAEQAAGMEGNVGMHNGVAEPVSFSGGAGELNGSLIDTEIASDFWLSGTFNFY
ncbi:hypothetical protein MPH_13163 [Macrophomina phaseolina MS6]|uniref:Uncharacterized protein n=1 Tax=Macrophomina phaseolina (strain MS6) TaxID=1126212 RepID=K2QIR6_MACPH|nr:hypothetical protein MPH_13163 [Macrophomina phaseolina MS6]